MKRILIVANRLLYTPERWRGKSAITDELDVTLLIRDLDPSNKRVIEGSRCV